MKKIIFTFALMVQVGFTMAGNKAAIMVQVRQNNVKMFQQAGTSTAILENINTSDRVEFVRKFNANWAIVTVNGKTGYVLFNEITQLKTNAR